MPVLETCRMDNGNKNNGPQIKHRNMQSRILTPPMPGIGSGVSYVDLRGRFFSPTASIACAIVCVNISFPSATMAAAPRAVDISATRLSITWAAPSMTAIVLSSQNYLEIFSIAAA